MSKHLKSLKKWWKSIKIANVNITVFIFSEPLEEFQLTFHERCDLILKVTKNQGFTFSLEDTFLEKPQGGHLTPPAVLGLKIAFY